MNFDQIKRAIIAKTKDKSNMPDWYYRRLEKCISCEFNSGNVEKLSLKDRIRISHNFGKDACLKCTCGVEDKSSDPEESCPEGYWKKENRNKTNTLTISTKSNKVKFYYENNTKKYIVDYGIIPYKYDSNIDLLIEEKDLKDVKIKTSCGCTVANTKNTPEGIVLGVKYDTLRVGEFYKNISIKYNKNNKEGQITITIKGEVKK
jgi:hypothetical protein